MNSTSEKTLQENVGFDASKFDPEAYRNRLNRLVSKYVPHDDVDDVVQNTLVRAYQALPKFRGGSTLETWLHRIAVNQCFDHNKKRMGQPSIEPIMDGEELEEQIAGRSDVMVSESHEPEREAMRNEMQQKVRAAIGKLPEKHQMMINLCDIDGKNYREAAAVMRVSEGTVKSGLHRARKALKRSLSGYVNA